eukprot:TRINITY_DN39672_c0_g1_i1.p1 TRINITY_DN39672_c0_g1~~TRINITY_DN39672_c0_g1_i1.p1  ORF type:complete len:238 (+),score=51.16 TRINITY_DN39672_c0_g1_i1:179-892(+)
MAQQFPWLIDALEQARTRKEKVYMLTHHSMSSMDQPYSNLLKGLTEEYNDVIVANFAGHAHTSFLQVLHDAETSTKPIDVTYISGSGTPDGGNPTFRVFYYDLETYELTDYDQYWVDMDQANMDGVAVYKKNHTATEHYGIKDLSGASWDALAHSWLNGSDTMVTWERYATAMTRGHLPASAQSRHANACTILSSNNTVFGKCMKDPAATMFLGDDHESPAAFDAAQTLIEIASGHH